MSRLFLGLEIRNPKSEIRNLFWMVLILLWVGIPFLGGAEPPPPGLSLRDTSLPVPVGATGRSPQRWEKDPFLPPSGSRVTTEETALALKAIIYHSPTRAVAIINHETVRSGERILGKRVLAIHPDRVILEDEAGRLELPVGRFTHVPGAAFHHGGSSTQQPRQKGGTP